MTRLQRLRWLRDQVTAEINSLERRYGRRTTPADDCQRLVAEAAERHGVTTGAILSRSRRRPVVRARQEVCWELRQLNLSYPQIAELLDRDHSTVLVAVRKVEAERRAGLWSIQGSVA